VGYKNTGLGGGAPDKATAIVEAWEDEVRGRVAEVRISSAEMGQGLPGVLAACAAEELGTPANNVSVLLGDTDVCPDGGPTTASRQTFVSGNAVRIAASRAARKLAEAPGRIAVVRYEYEAPRTQPLGSGGDMHIVFSYCAQAALCEIDMRTGEVSVRRIIAAHDVGRAINPLTLEGQIEGGIVMGVGFTLTEHFIQEDGTPWTHVMARYKTPSIEHAPTITSFIVEDAVEAGPFGAKGVGELPSIPVSAAITNAIQRATGIRVRSLPVDQDELLRAMQRSADEVELAWGDRAPIPVIGEDA
jgi:xanthine dehydrogenase molybdenum-binding subunit